MYSFGYIAGLTYNWVEWVLAIEPKKEQEKK